MKHEFTKAHEYAEIFPLADEGQEFDEFVKDIKENGQAEPILKYKGLILDGRRRERACWRAGVKPKFKEFKGDDGEALTLVISKNLHRRHLGTGDRAIIAAKVAKMPRPSKKSPASSEAASQGAAADALNVSRSSVQRAKIVIEGGTKKLISAVRDKTITLTDASSIAKLPHKAQNKAVKLVREDKAKTVHEAAYPLCDRCKDVGKIDDCTACLDLHERFVSGKKEKPKKPDHYKDTAGIIVPARLMPVFEAVDLFTKAQSQLNGLAKTCKLIEKTPAWGAKRVDPSKQHFKKFYLVFRDAREQLAALAPELVCGMCEGDGCAKCNDLGWLTHEMANMGGLKQ